jgi:hypothetical protein
MKNQIRHFASLVMVLLACFTFSSCGDDDDSVKGTWKVISETEGSYLVGKSLTFTGDGNVTISPSDDDDWTYMKWSVDGNTLKVILGEGHADDYVEGTYTISGKKGTFSYHWGDCDGKWVDDEIYTIVAERQ